MVDNFLDGWKLLSNCIAEIVKQDKLNLLSFLNLLSQFYFKSPI